MNVENSALIIVDMQNDFLHKDGFVRRHAEEIGMPESAFDLLRSPVSSIKRLSDIFHEKQKEVIYIYTAWEADYCDVAIPLKSLQQTARQEGCLVRGRWGAQIIDELMPNERSRLVMKKAYGGFFQTILDRTLRNLSIRTLFMTGVATNFCVETTAREAVGYGYDVVMVSDATATYDTAGHAATLNVINLGFGTVMSADKVIELVSA